MNNETEIARLTKENDTFRKIIEAQQKTILRLVDYFILEAENSTEERTL